MGFLLPEMDEAYGGAGGNLAYQLVVQDELAKAEMPVNIAVHTIASHDHQRSIALERAQLRIGMQVVCDVALGGGRDGGIGGHAGSKCGNRLSTAARVRSTS